MTATDKRLTPRHDVDRRFWTEEMDDRLAEFYCLAGLDFPEIAAALGVSPCAVLVRKACLGLTLTPQARVIRRHKRRTGHVYWQPTRDHSTEAAA